MTERAHTSVQAAGLPDPIGPYSPGMIFDKLVIVSGQGATDPATGALAGPDVETQTRQVFENIKAILDAAGSDLSKVLRCGVFLVDLTPIDDPELLPQVADGSHDHLLARDALEHAIAGLPENQQDVIRLFWFEHLPYAEIARRLDASESAVKVRAHRAYKALREIIGGEK